MFSLPQEASEARKPHICHHQQKGSVFMSEKHHGVWGHRSPGWKTRCRWATGCWQHPLMPRRGAGSGERAGGSFGPYIRGLCRVLGPLEKRLLEIQMAGVEVLPPVHTYRAPSVFPPDLQVTQPSLPEDCSLAEQIKRKPVTSWESRGLGIKVRRLNSEQLFDSRHSIWFIQSLVSKHTE